MLSIDIVLVVLVVVVVIVVVHPYCCGRGAAGIKEGMRLSLAARSIPVPEASVEDEEREEGTAVGMRDVKAMLDCPLPYF